MTSSSEGSENFTSSARPRSKKYMCRLTSPCCEHNIGNTHIHTQNKNTRLVHTCTQG